MPYPNIHSARVRDPGDFIKNTFSTVPITAGIQLISGKLVKGGPMTAQAYHFDKKVFTPVQAKAWLKKHNVKYISFEAAEAKKLEDLPLSCASCQAEPSVAVGFYPAPISSEEAKRLRFPLGKPLQNP